MIRLNVYKKENIDMNLLIGSFEKDRWNMPFYNTDITLWKGVDNTIEFSVRNHDRKSQKLKENQFLKFVAVNNELQQMICKKMDVVNADLGRYSVTITENELNNYDEGHFVGHVSVVTGECPENCKNCQNCPLEEDLLYSGLDWNPNFNVEIKPNKLNLIKESTILSMNDFSEDTYTDTTTGKVWEKYTSTIMKSDVTPNHSFILKLRDFDGIIKIQGSNQEAPTQSDEDWFLIDERNYEIVEEDDDYIDDNISINAELNCLWVRIQYLIEQDKPGMILEAVYRN